MPDITSRHKLAKLLIAAFIALMVTLSLLPKPEPADRKAAVQALFASSASSPEGKSELLSQWRDRIVVVNYWATWCPPCRQEMPALARLSRQFASNGVQFVGIAIDSVEHVRQYMAENHHENEPPYPLLIGDDAALAQSSALGNHKQALPFTVLIDRHGEVQFTHLGAIDEAQLAARLQSLITAP